MATVVEAGARNRLASPRLATRGPACLVPARPPSAAEERTEEPHPPTSAAPGL